MKTDTIQTRKWITKCLMALLCFCLVLTGMLFIAPIEAEAAVGDNFLVDGIVYTVLSEEEGDRRVSVTANTLTESTAGDIPQTIENNGVEYTVTAIGTNAFQNCTYLTKIELPATLTTINARAFTGCSSLREVRMYSTTANIGQNAFPSEGVEAWYYYSGSTIESYIPENHEGLYGMHLLYDVTINYGNNATAVFKVEKPLAVGETIELPLLGQIATRKGYELSSLICNNGTTYTDRYLISNGRTVAMISGGLTFTVNWTPKTYTVTLDPNGGEQSSTTVTATYMNAMPAVEGHYPFRVGYDFNGYYLNATGATGQQYYDADMNPTTYRWGIDEDRSIYARWTPKTFSVTYDLDGGTHDECIDFTATYGESYVLLPATAPTKPGCTFAGWTYFYAMDGYSASEDMIGQETVFEFDEDIKFTAVWKPRSPVRFEITQSAREQKYFLNAPFVRFGGSMYYDNGEHEWLTVYETDVENFSTAEIQREPVTATVTKQGVTATFTYTVDYDYENCEHVFVQSNLLVAECTVCDTAVILEKDFASYQYDGNEKPIVVILRDGVYDISGMTVNYSRTDGQTHSSTDVPVNPGKYRATTVLGDCVLTYDYEIYITYTVRHLVENTDGTYSEYSVLRDQRTYNGLVNISAIDISYYVPQQSKISMGVNWTNDSIIDFYYDRATYPLTFDTGSVGSYDGASTVTVDAKWGYDLYHYVEEQSIPEYDNINYVFKGWSLESNPEIQADFIITEETEDEIPMGSLTVYAVFAERELVGIEIPEDKLVQWYSKLSTEKFREFEAFIRYADNSTEPITVTENMLTGFDLSVLTPLDEYCTATVNYKTFSANFKYYVRNISQIEYCVKLDEGYYESDVLDYYEGQTITLMDGTAFERTGYTFLGWDIWDNELSESVFYEAGASYTLKQGDTVASGVWKLNTPTITISGVEPLEGDNKAEYVLEFTYDGNAHNVTLHASHELGDAVTYTYYMIMDGDVQVNLNPDNLRIPPWHMIESDTYGFVDADESAYYSFTVTVTDGNDTTVAYFRIKVAIGKADQTITLSENEFIYSEGLTIDFADYVDGTGDGTLSFEVSDKNGVEFDFANGVVSNITKAGGTFTLTVNKAATDNYNSATQTFTVTLNKGTQTLSVSGSPNPPTWKQEYQVSVSGNKGALSYAIISGNATVNESGVITATGTGQIRYSVTAAATNLYEAVTVERTVTFGKAAGNLAPDYVAPSEQTICAESGDLYEVIAVPDGWYMNTIKMVQSGVLAVTATFTPSDTVNYDTYVEEFTVYVEEHAEGDEATCTTPQICTRCNTVLAEALGHDFSSSAWTDLGESGHAHKCSRCDEYDEAVPHSSEDEATCTTPKTCDSCGYVMEPSGDHSFTEEIADTAHLKEEASSCVSGATYWYDCAYCDEISDTLYFTAGAQGAHSFDEDGFCTLCDGVEAPYYNENRDINGDGTPDGAYEVSKVGHLYWFPSDYGEYIDGNVFLMNDIVVNENVLLEDGSLNASAVESFRIWKLLFGLGEDYVFDGNGKFISGLYLIDYDSGFGVGGLLGENYGIIKNLTVKNSYLEGYEFSSIVYYNGGIVENCHSVNNTLVSKYGGGGVVGINYGNGTIKDCTNSSNLYVENGLDDETYEIFLGGIVAIINEGEVIKNCVNYGTITATANGSEYIAVGGIIGGNNREDIVEITNCHNKGNIIVQSIFPAVGGVVGFGVYNRISDCTNTGNITVDANYDEAVGGIIGVSSFSVTIERCYNAGDIEINAGSFGYTVAGIAGWTMTTTIVNSYNVGNIEVTFDENFDVNNADIMASSGIANIDTSLVCNCYNAGEIIIPAEYQSTLIYGGVILLDDNDTSSLIENNYYLNATANEYGGRTAEQFASGEVAYALCKQIVIDEEFTIDGSAWGQTIGTDLTPVFDGDKVYAISHCANNATLYANDQSAVYILTKTDAKESTCQVQGNNAYWTCSICNKVYADENCTIVTSVEDSKLDLADHDWSATWDYEDEDGHAHKCLTPDCNEISTLEDHVEGAPATEDDPQLCTECGYVITPATGHVNHVSSGEYGYDENSHWFKCTGCDTYKIDQTAHQFDNACDVDCICGYQRTIEHDYTELKFNETHHWYACSVCGSEKANSRVDHSGGTSNCQHKAECATCGQTYGGYGSHTFGKWQEEISATCVATGTKAHKTCSTCEKHFAEDGVTEINDLTIAIDSNNHDIATEWTGVENGHYHKCKRTGCEYHTALEDHQPDRSEATETEPIECSVCEYVITPATGHITHTSSGIYGYDANGHWFKCVGCETEKVSPAGHSFDNDCDTDCACGYVRTITHDFTGEWEKDASGHWHVCTKNGCSVTDTKQNHVSAGAATETDPEVCSICGWQIAPALGHTTHTPEAEWQKNETHHWHECTGCDDQELDKAAHVDDNGDNKCDTCNYSMPEHNPDTPSNPEKPAKKGCSSAIGTTAGDAVVVVLGGFALFWFVIRKKRGF